MIVSEGLASIELELCKCGGKARFRHENKLRLLVECIECGAKSPYTTMRLIDESNCKEWQTEQLAHGRFISKIWNNLQVIAKESKLDGTLPQSIE